MTRFTAEGWARAQRVYDQQHPLWGSLRKPGEPPAPTMSEWVAKIARLSAPVREYDEPGRFQPLIRREGAA